jgi:hypothetical protein
MKAFTIGDRVLAERCESMRSYCAAGLLCFAAVGYAGAAQSQENPSHFPRPGAQIDSPAPLPSHNLPAGRTPGAPPVKPAAEKASPDNVAASPAKVILDEGKLTIETNNSDLAQILAEVAGRSGMTVDGNVGNIRVFGVYGPGNPGDVLTDLLSGSGYNFMMVGKLGDGAPRELLLTAKSSGPPSPASPRPTTAALDDRDDSDGNAADDEPPGPGAVTHVPPPPSQDPQERMQQNLQRLQQQRQPPQEQNPAPPQ